MSRLLLIRHGQTTSNVSHALDTNLPGAALTDLGWSQARAAGERLARERTGEGAEDGDGQDAPLAMVSSQALRARQTAAGIALGGSGRGLQLERTAPGSDFADALAQLAELEVTDGLDHVDVGPEESATAGAPAALGGGTTTHPTASGSLTPSDVSSVSSALHRPLPLVMPGAVPGISEIPAGQYEMRVDPDAHYGYHRTFAEWLGGSMDLPVPGASTGREVVGRYLGTLLPVLSTAQRAGSDLAVVSHGAVIRLIAAYLGRVDPEFAVRTLLPNTLRVDLEVPDLGGSLAPEDLSEAVAEGWKVTDWAGHGEPPRAGRG
ncbi:MAG: histidine phosphatase family protein [Corynebacterium sp.]|uniref:histidine phosphatase family protein n=1 Tax=unclassified Corynebacterium TaxID=2624378 RepID=UPI0009662BCC|nr:histidine phosphatase family protein [Corynebacterium sp. CNJ-954]